MRLSYAVTPQRPSAEPFPWTSSYAGVSLTPKQEADPIQVAWKYSFTTKVFTIERHR
jgi:hypothetical protein